MITAVIIASFAFVFYTYLGYPLALWALARRQESLIPGTFLQPAITVVIAAFNEELCLRETLESILKSDYPADRLDIIVVSDASTDRTDEIAGSFGERVRLLRQPERCGQTAGLFRGAREARGEIILMADASGLFLSDTVHRLATHFADARVGAASGAKGIRRAETAVAKGEGIYARYDSLLRALESRTGSSWVGCQGGLFAIRKALLHEDFPLDMAADNAMCYELYERGALHRFDPAAIALERPSENLKNEFRRKVRIIVLQLHGFFFFRRLLRPFKHPDFFFQNVSHKIFRWLAPFALLLLWIASALDPQPWTRGLFALQCLFYTLAIAGIFFQRWRPLPRWLSIPPYFLTVNLAGLLAWGALFRNYVIWNPPERARTLE